MITLQNMGPLIFLLYCSFFPVRVHQEIFSHSSHHLYLLLCPPVRSIFHISFFFFRIQLESRALDNVTLWRLASTRWRPCATETPKNQRCKAPSRQVLKVQHEWRQEKCFHSSGLLLASQKRGKKKRLAVSSSSCAHTRNKFQPREVWLCATWMDRSSHNNNCSIKPWSLSSRVR